ncbi:MAG: hypothetical protein HYY95_07395 [Candidatus Rokubacteria bacterium]|nr:hypothetical protein [Candidatus Rokubacteria bacterium]MBI3105382.1 hypothetical protein [Candidatus Rokubacteria bacterium]
MDYIGLGATGCTVEDVTFFSFSEVTPPSPGTTQIPSASVSLTPVTGPGGPGFLFAGSPIAAGPASLLELFLGFQATPASGDSFIGNSIALDSSALVAGDGAITIVESKCLGAVFSSPSVGCAGTPVTLIPFAIEGLSDLEESATFAPPVSFFDVFVELVVDGGVAGNASLGPSLGELHVATARAPTPTPVAGPPAILMVGAGLAGWLGWRARSVRSRV